MRLAPGHGLALALLAASGSCLAAETEADASDAARIESAVQYVKHFLKVDADPRWGGLRDVSAPPAPDFPTHDCDLTTIVRTIRQMGAPSFEDDSHRIVKVPVVAEVVMFRDAGTGGGASDTIGCTFEYERYDFHAGAFVHLPHFREQKFNQSLMEWGEARDRWMPATKVLPPEWRKRSIAVRPENRYARFVMRIDVAGPEPYRTLPQVPRHLYARDELARMDAVIRDYSQRLVFRKSDLAPDATGPGLEAELERIRGQLGDYQWMAEKIRSGLFVIGDMKAFFDIKQ